MTTIEAAARLGLKTHRAVITLIKRGQIAATKHGRDWWIEPDEIERFTAQRRKPGRPRKA